MTKGNVFLPGTILFEYIREIEAKSQTAFKNQYPSLDDYDGGTFICPNPKRAHQLRELDFDNDHFDDYDWWRDLDF